VSNKGIVNATLSENNWKANHICSARFAMGKRVKVGDVIEVATKRGLAYVQLTHRGRLIGDVVRVLPGFLAERPKSFHSIVQQNSELQLQTAMVIWVHRGNFVVVANEPVPESAKTLPLFKQFERWGKPPINAKWSIVDIEQNILVEKFDSEDLPAKYRDLPNLGVYGHELDLADFIERGLRNRDMVNTELVK
jgi:hypothetical protein